MSAMRILGLPDQLNELDRTLVMGIINVTTDSFSDGGRHLELDDALRRARTMMIEGADIIDIGGESTRPGAERVSEQVERDRVIPLLREMVDLGAIVSVDTMRAAIAEEAISAGAAVINDVSGGLADPVMGEVIAAARVPFVAMHWRGHSERMQTFAQYKNVTHEVRDELAARVDGLVMQGVELEQIIIDPGLGFAKTPAHNWELLHNFKLLKDLNLPILVGASRKRFLGELLSAEGVDRALDERDDATVALTALAAHAGAWCVRVHEVRGNRDAVEVARGWRAKL
ncbi:dihydropteroate synthase 1 [mine drainage metagenome]|uniref:dihydropteroate synthase n=1 Tax=mine drainage metagenome TaxID=410659 RepID=A0A1J5PZQ2_9ZZZZ